MLVMRELSQLLLNFESPFRTLALGLLLGCGLGLKAHPEMLSAISLRAQSMATDLLTLPVVSLHGQGEADYVRYPTASGRRIVNEAGIGVSLIIPSATVPLDALSTQAIEKCIYAIEPENISVSGTTSTVSSPTFFLRVRCQPSRPPSVKLNYRNSTLFCLKELEGPSESPLALDTHRNKDASLPTSISSEEYRPMDGSWPLIYTVPSVIAFGLTASLLGYVFGISFLYWIMTTILGIPSKVLFFVKLAFDVASDPLFFIILGLFMVYEACKSIVSFGSIATGTFYSGSSCSQATVILCAQRVSDMLFFGVDLIIYVILLCVHGVSVILLTAGHPIFFGIKLAFPRYSNDDIMDYMITMGRQTIWPAFENSRVLYLVLYLLDITCTFSVYIQSIFDVGTQIAISSLLFGVNAIFCNCLLPIRTLAPPFYGSGHLLASGAKGIWLRIPHIAFPVDYIFPSLFYFFMLPAHIQDRAEMYLETVIHFVFSMLLNGLLNVLVCLFLFFDGIAHAYHNPGPSSPRWTRRDRRIIERLRKKGIVFAGTSIALQPSTPFSPKQYVELYEDEDGVRNIRKYHAADYKFVAKIKCTGVDNISIVQHRVHGRKLVLRTASLQGPGRKSLVAELRALVQVDGCRWFPALMDGLMDGTELHVLTTFCPRGNLQDYICRIGGCLDARLAKFYLAEIFIAIQAAHAFGIIHRRVCTENLLLGDSGHLVLSNFSHCKVFDHRKLDDEIIHPKPKDPEDIEQALNSVNIDYYHMALVYYEMITGWHLASSAPFVHGPIGPREDHMQRLTTEDVRFLSRILDNFPANSPSVSEMTDSSLFDGVDWEAMCYQDASVPRTHRPLRSRSSLPSVRFVNEDSTQAGPSRTRGHGVVSPNTTV